MIRFYLKPLSLILFVGIIACKSEETSQESTSSNDLNKNQEAAENKSNNSSLKMSFSGLLVQLESYTGWDAVNPIWIDRRESWLKDCESAKTPEEKGGLLIEFETIVNWNAVNPKWADRRDKWTRECKSAGNDGELAMLLAEFESYILWEAVSPEWVNVRDQWIANCNSLAEAGTGSSW